MLPPVAIVAMISLPAVSPRVFSPRLDVPVSPTSGQRGLLARSVMRLAAACLLVLGLLAFDDFLAPPPARYAPGLPFNLTLAGPALIILGIVLLASFSATKAAKAMIIVGSSFAGLGGLAMLLAVLTTGKGAMAEGFDFVFVLALFYLLLTGAAVAAAGAVLAAVLRRSRSKPTG